MAATDTSYSCEVSGSSEVVLEGGSRFEFTLALPASQGFDGSTKVIGWPFKEVTLLWIDVELTDASCSWLGEGGEEGAVQIGFGIGQFLALFSCWVMGGRCRSIALFWHCSGLATAWLQVTWTSPVPVSFQISFSGDFVPRRAFRPVLVFSVLLFSVSPLHFQLCVFVYGYCCGLVCHCWIFCSYRVVALNQMVWVGGDDGGGPAAVLLLVTDSGQAGWNDLGFPRLPFLSAQCICYLYFLVVLLCTCFLFPDCPCYSATRLNGCYYFCCCMLSVVALIVWWQTFVKWMLPPSVRMKCRVFKLFIDFGWLHEEVDLLTSLLCLYVGNFSSMDSCYFKTIRVAFDALVVFRASENSCMAFIAFRKLSLLLRVVSDLSVVFVHEVRFYAPLVVHLC